MDLTVRTSSCVCGRVRCEAVGAPILSGVCYCDNCQEGGRRIEALPHAAPVLDADGGTSYLTYRSDRFRCVSGAELLTDYRIREGSPTRRVVASCCNSAMFLKFEPGFWVSSYRARFAGDAPPVEMRTQTKYRRAATELPRDAPSYRGYGFKLWGRLIAARLAMFIGR